MTWPVLFGSAAGQEVQHGTLPSAMFTMTMISLTVTWPPPLQSPRQNLGVLVGVDEAALVGIVVAVGVGVETCVTVLVRVGVSLLLGIVAGVGVIVGGTGDELVAVAISVGV